MEIKTISNTEIEVIGNIKTIDDSTALRDAVQRLFEGGSTAIIIKIQDSFAMPSAVVGYFMKLVNRDKVKLTILAGDPRLAELLDELQLTAVLNVRRLA